MTNHVFVNSRADRSNPQFNREYILS